MGEPKRDDKPKGAKEAAGAAPPRRRSIVTMTLLGVAVALVLDGLVGERGLLANRRERAKLDQSLQVLESVRQRNAELAERARRLKTDPKAIEEVARKEGGFIRPGEKVFILKDVPKPPR